jgi:hypothetical protein
MTAVAEVHDGFKQHGDDQVYRVSARVTAPVNAR